MHAATAHWLHMSVHCWVIITRASSSDEYLYCPHCQRKFSSCRYVCMYKCGQSPYCMQLYAELNSGPSQQTLGKGRGAGAVVGCYTPSLDVRLC